jgi:1-phosphofructokinase
MTGRVVTLTFNPAIDETVLLDELQPGSVHRARDVRFDAGGKGVNVASCLADWGIPVVATGILGAANDGVFTTLFHLKAISDQFLRVAGDTRVNIKLVHGGATTDINLPGLAVPPSAVADIACLLENLAGAGDIVVLAGSLPNGVEPAVYRDLTAILASRGVKVVLDTSGQPLEEALAPTAEALPFCVKPNRAELEAWTGRTLSTTAQVVEAARSLVERGVSLAVVSLGQDGALFITQGEALQASLPVVNGVSTVGAGDAMVAGIVAALNEGRDLEGIARLATAFAASKLGRPGPNLPARQEVETRAGDVAIRSAREQQAQICVGGTQ